jgi:broad specificity phosphatase PhoE
MRTTIVLARHGETDWNRDGVFQGHADPPLNDTGRAQARELAGRLAGVHVDVVYASDLRRAFQTAEIVAAAKGLEVVPDPGLREVDVGSWSGLTRAQIEERFPGVEHHDGESREAHRERVVRAVTRIAAAHPGETVLVVSHGGSLRALHRHALGDGPPRLANCETYRLAFEAGTFRGLD